MISRSLLSPTKVNRSSFQPTNSYNIPWRNIIALSQSRSTRSPNYRFTLSQITDTLRSGHASPSYETLNYDTLARWPKNIFHPSKTPHKFRSDTFRKGREQSLQFMYAEGKREYFYVHVLPALLIPSPLTSSIPYTETHSPPGPPVRGGTMIAEEGKWIMRRLSSTRLTSAGTIWKLLRTVRLTESMWRRGISPGGGGGGPDGGVHYSWG